MEDSHSPPALTIIDHDEFRRKLANLADPSSSAGALTPPTIKIMAIRFVTILADLFNGDALDQKTLWDRIDTALATSLAKCGGGDDIDRFASLCLEHVKADATKAACCGPLIATLETLGIAMPEDRNAFLAYFRDHRYPAIAFGRQRWQLVKSKEVEL